MTTNSNKQTTSLESIKESSQQSSSAKKVIYYGTGRRKSASVARVFLDIAGSGKIIVNNIAIADYLPQEHTQKLALNPLTVVNCALSSVDINITVQGGGFSGQAGAIRLGLARALATVSEEFRKQLRSAGELTRIALKVERKKVGRRGARKKEQFSKR